MAWTSWIPFATQKRTQPQKPTLLEQMCSDLRALEDTAHTVLFSQLGYVGVHGRDANTFYIHR